MTLFYDKPSGNGRFSPFLSYQVLKYIGLLLIGISQFVMIREVYAYVFPNSGFVIPDNFASLLKSLSVVGTPLVMISLFANFMYNRQNIKFFMLLYFVMFVTFIFAEKAGIAILGNYINKELNGTDLTPKQIEALIDDLQVLLVSNGGINMFIDFFLFAVIFFFIFYTPKKHVRLFRWCVCIPLAYLIGSYCFFITLNYRPDLYKVWDIYLLAEIINVCPSKNLSTYVLYFAVLYYVSRKDIELDFKGVDSRDFSRFVCILLVLLSIAEMFLSYIPNIDKFNLGNSYYLFVCVPIVLLFDYKCEIKHPWITYTQPVYYLLQFGLFFYYLEKMLVYVLQLLKTTQNTTGLIWFN